MEKTIEAVYEDGVFKPLKTVDIQEHERVEIRVLPKDEWQVRFNKLIEKIQSRAVQYSSDEIESDIAQAVQEVRIETK